MKKLFAASLLSISLCVSQTGSVWASTQTHFPPPVSSEGTDVSPQMAPIVEIIIAGLILAGILKALEVAWDMWNDDKHKNAQDICDFYENYRETYRDVLTELGDNIYGSGFCPYLFDKYGNDIDSEDECYIWEPNPEWGIVDGIEMCESP